jgi:hypothetical protein
MDDAFWLRYLQAHADRRTRTIHTAGTIAASTIVVAAIATRRPLWLLAACVAGYAPAWSTHALIEHNRPETFSRPVASLLADYRMAYLLLTGKLDLELQRAGVPR